MLALAPLLLLVLARAAAVGAVGAAEGHHLQFMSVFGTDPQLQRGTVNLAHRSYGNSNPWDQFELAANNSVQLWEQFGIASLYGPLPYDQPAAEKGMPGRWGEYGNIFMHTGPKGDAVLAPGWQATLTEIVNRYIKPQFGIGKPFRGVRLGDEVCLSTVCLMQTLGPVAAFLKGALGPTLIISSQEMHGVYPGFPNYPASAPQVPAAIDLVCATGGYGGYSPGESGIEEASHAKTALTPWLRSSSLRSYQRVMLLPGIFGCKNTSYFGTPQEQGVRVAAKLDAYYAWAKTEPKVAGFDPWHFDDRTEKQWNGPCDQRMGAAAMPAAVAKLQQIGREIIANHKTDDASAAAPPHHY